MAQAPDTLGPDELDDQALLALLRLSDPLGVLSIYVGVEPAAVGRGGKPPWQTDLKNRLAELEEAIAEEGTRERVQGLRRCLAELAPELDELVAPYASGRGRALFAPLGGGHTRFTSQLALPTRVVLNSAPFIHPLLELVDEGRAAGVLLASQKEATMLEWRFGELETLDVIDLDRPHALSGPPGPVSSPQGRQGTPIREARERRERAHQGQIVERLASEVARRAGARRWDRVLVAAGERLTAPIVEALPAELASAAIADPRQLANLDLATQTASVTERLHESRSEEKLALVRQVRALALGHGAGAVGLSEVVAALNEGRVAHLIYDPEVRYRGRIGVDGLLFAEDELHSAAAPAEPESRLTERIVERCVETRARITPVEHASASALAEAGGIGALLRW